LKILFLALALLFSPSVAPAAEERVDRPHWSLELKGGVFFPGLSHWSDFYGTSYTPEFGGALAYKVIRQIEVGVEGTYLSADGNGQAPLHAQLAGGSQVAAGQVSYELIPLNVFVLARGVFSEDQLLVPYLGGGWTRMFYREEVKGQGKVQGSTNGFHARGGIQLLLDRIDAEGARNLDRDYHLRHTYFFAEAKYTRATADTVPSGTVNLGGVSYLGGLLFEF
jgi:hypothetical protein